MLANQGPERITHDMCQGNVQYVRANAENIVGDTLSVYFHLTRRIYDTTAAMPAREFDRAT